tara:strand:- start:224 stop:388 length:165 start_codon:yes stop_codon:yes gene_type:complete
MKLDRQLLMRIKDLLESEIAKNKQFTYEHDVSKYRKDIKTLVYVNYQLQQARYK